MTTSLRQAVDGKCKECIYDPYDRGAGRWREQVENCTAVDCKLFPLRPVTQETARIQAQGSAISVRQKERHRKGLITFKKTVTGSSNPLDAPD